MFCPNSALSRWDGMYRDVKIRQKVDGWSHAMKLLLRMELADQLTCYYFYSTRSVLSRALQIS